MHRVEMGRAKFRAYHVTPRFHAQSTDLGFSGGFAHSGDHIGLCLARLKAPDDEGIYLSFPHGGGEHTSAAVRRAFLTRTAFSIELEESSKARMDGLDLFEITFVLTDPEFTELARALAEIFHGIPAYVPPPPVSYDS